MLDEYSSGVSLEDLSSPTDEPLLKDGKKEERGGTLTGESRLIRSDIYSISVTGIRPSEGGNMIVPGGNVDKETK